MDDPQTLGATILLMTALAALAFLSLLILRCTIELLWRSCHTRPVVRRKSTPDGASLRFAGSGE
jgi:hypothetical protein